MYKQAIVVRSDLKMGKGKLAAQASHASLSSYLLASKKSPVATKTWLATGQKKIVLKVESEGELLEYFELCRHEGFMCELIRDAGHTQLLPNTITCFGCGPQEEEKLDSVLGKLKLL